MEKVLHAEGVGGVVFGQCCFDSKFPGKDNLWLQKHTRFVSNHEEMLKPVRGKRLKGGHPHGRIQGSYLGQSISSYAARYPPRLCEAIADGVVAVVQT